MKVSFLAAGILASCLPSAAKAEAWTCTYVMDGSKEASLHQFEVSPPDLVERQSNEHYLLLQNNEFGLVATSAISAIEQGQQKPTVGASTVVINKQTGDFWWGTLIAGLDPALEGINKPIRGKCIRD